MKPATRGTLRITQRGFTIVEFMVALAIGLVVSVVIGQIFVGSRQSFSSQEDSARMQESMRNAALLMTRTIRLAGFRNNPGLDPNTIFPKATTPVITGANDVVVSGLPTQTTNKVAPTGASPAVTPDTITVRFQGSGGGGGAAADGTIVDCIGNSIDFGVMVSNTFGIRPVTKADGTLSSSLFCSIDGGATWPATSELVSDVDNMQVLYGVDTDNDGAANVFVRIGDVADVDTIVSVRLWLLLRSQTATYINVQPSTFTLAGNTFTYNDRFTRQVLYTTVNLRNRTL